jgi:nitrate reductase delta subunit
MADDSNSHLYRLFADLLEYPSPALTSQAQAAAAGAGMGQAAALLTEFYSFVEQASPARLEELYTGTFDLQAVCYPYVGYHLFGDNYKRGMFMAQLNAGYRERGFSAGKELPDHVAVILRFLAPVPEAERSGASVSENEFSQGLLHEGLIPAVDTMVKAFGNQSDNPYAGVIRALLLVLRGPDDQV